MKSHHFRTHRNQVRTALVAAVTALGLVLTGCAAGGSTPAPAATSLGDVRVAGIQGSMFEVPLQLAIAQGYGTAHGANISEIPLPPTTTQLQFLQSKSADVFFASPATLGVTYQTGTDVQFFCGAFITSSLAIVAPKDSTLPSMGDGASWKEVAQALKGTTIGMPVPVGAPQSLSYLAAFDDGGVAADQITFVNTGTNAPVILGAFTSHTISAAIVAPPSKEVLLASGMKIIANWDDKGPKPQRPKVYYGQGWMASKEWIEANPKLATAFCAAMKDAYAYMQSPKNAAAVDSKSEEVFGVDAAVAKQVRKIEIPLWDSVVPIDVMKTTVPLLLQYGIVKPTPALTVDMLVAQGYDGAK